MATRRLQEAVRAKVAADAELQAAIDEARRAGESAQQLAELASYWATETERRFDGSDLA